jgi:hypothetical protein
METIRFQEDRIYLDSQGNPYRVTDIDRYEGTFAFTWMRPTKKEFVFNKNGREDLDVWESSSTGDVTHICNTPVWRALHEI